MLGPVKVGAAMAMLVLVQDSGTPPADALQERASALAASINSKLRMELNGCMKDERNSTAITCYYRLANSFPVEVHATAPKSRADRVTVELPGAKQEAMVGIAFFLADLLIPGLPPAELLAFEKKAKGDFAGPFAAGSTGLGPYVFDYRYSGGKTTLTINTRAENAK
jgi:hypothetical protein